MTDVVFKLNATGTGSIRKAAEMRSDKVKLVCVDSKLAQAAAGDAAGAGGGGAAAGGGGA
jgi:hypothetical protein